MSDGLPRMGKHTCLGTDGAGTMTKLRQRDVADWHRFSGLHHSGYLLFGHFVEVYSAGKPRPPRSAGTSFTFAGTLFAGTLLLKQFCWNTFAGTKMLEHFVCWISFAGIELVLLEHLEHISDRIIRLN